MSTSVFPALLGQGWSVDRDEIWKTRKQTSVSGKEVRIADWSFPRHKFSLSFEFLRQGTLSGSAYTEFAQLSAFFNLRSGGFDSFLYKDPDDYIIAGQQIGIGDAVTTVFPMVRALGGYIEPILAPNLSATLNIYLNAVLQSGSAYTVTPWGTANSNGPGQLIFNSAPGAGVAVTADFSWYFPCSFDDDTMSFSKFMQGLYEQKKTSFTSIK